MDYNITHLVIGFAGSGKTSLIKKIHKEITKIHINNFIINLDPFYFNLPYSPNIDICDNLNVSHLRKTLKLGPNNELILMINLFITKFDQVLKFLMKNTNKSSKIILFDFPGQIEIFLWSISGFIITNLLKYGFKTNILFVIDVHRNVSYQPIFFNLMLSMLIVFKTRSKIQLILNKTDCTKIDQFMSYINQINYTYEIENKNIFKDISLTLNKLILENIFTLFPYSICSCFSYRSSNELLPFISSY